MTLTQVSTWFANARRRLKKENKMTWEPRNKCNSGSGDEDESSDIEYVSNETSENNEMTTILSENQESRLQKRLDKLDHANDKMINGQTNGDQLNRQLNGKCEDSDSNTSSNLKRNSPSTFDNYSK